MAFIYNCLKRCKKKDPPDNEVDLQDLKLEPFT